ncbi:putative RND superfamily exporter [Salinarchaeum sp. Harcht-Bsk1]|uniref:efflux RND transporter permease subunit n=1 Tax=Salinarchaeum sp. Harcht-Bsk1 TaxID=1333523 RepID=UPI00034240E2|nr:MMPL family transporter [Salinarchaeum sp. Harcht-Bsk1]AGN00501.1 putative RND superfamily exporter [Salinarchaeum sp. Harcht-Bsk1]
MIRRYAAATTDFVTTHSRIVLLLTLLLTAGMAAGTTHLSMGGEGGGIGAAVDTHVDDRAQYIEEEYGASDSGDDGVARTAVYVRSADGNALSKEHLLATLRFQRTVLEADAVDAALRERPAGSAGPRDGASSIASMVGTRAADESDPTIEEQIAALEATDATTVTTIVDETIAENERARRLLPDSYESGTATAESHQVVFGFDEAADGRPPSDATAALHDAASGRTDPTVFTVGEHALAASQGVFVENTMTLIVPVVLALILGVAAFTYRDPVDVLLGIVGVVVSILWMFGLLGWAGVAAGPAAVIGPVLVAGLSIDYGFHVFMRYREERNADESVRPAMGRGLRSVAPALALVTITAAIGFLATVATPVGMLRDLGIGITVGVVAAFGVFLTLIPALTVEVDALVEGAGFDRHRRPLGQGRYVRSTLAGAVTLARRGAPVVLVVAIVLATAGGLAWATLDQASVQQQSEPAAEWKQDLPGPMGWEENDLISRQAYVADQFRTTEEGDRMQMLIEGDVTDDGTLDAIDAGLRTAERRGAIPSQRAANVRSPLTVIRSVAERSEAFGATVAAADADGDGVPDRNLDAVYDHLYRIEPESASQVIERSDGRYESLRVVGPPEAAAGTAVPDDRATDLRAVEDRIETEQDGLTATVVSDATAQRATLETITDGILRTMVLALVAVFGVLVATFRLVHGSGTLGAVTAGPIVLVLGFVVGGMALLDVPLTFLTALLVSLLIGIGVDHNIHVGDRFAQELDRGNGPVQALHRAVIGTGGALLGSTLTTVAAFAALVLHPNPQFESFATLVILALLAALATSMLVLPSALLVWWRYGCGEWTASKDPEPAPA